MPGPGNALNFNGSDYLQCGTDSRGVTQRVTVEAWIRTANSNYQWILGKYSDADGEEKGYALITIGGVASFDGRAGLGQYYSSGRSITRVDDNRWHHVAGVCNGGVWQIFVDGNLENSGSYGYTNGNLSNVVPMSVGVYYVQNGQYFRGQMDELRVWRTARNVADIRASMCRRFASVPVDLVTYYRLDENSGTTAPDAGSVPNNGQFVGFFGGSSWLPSGAPVGDVSASAYATTASTRVALAAANGDSVIVSNTTPATRGIQVYAVNSAPLNSPGAGAAGVYFGVFGVPPAAGYTVRVRPRSLTPCTSIYSRPANDAAGWASLPTTTTTTGASLAAVNQSYRAEYIAVNTITPPSPNITGDTLLCTSGGTVLNATTAGAVSYLWNNGATSATISATQPGTYSVAVGFGSGCSVSARRAVVRATARVTGDSLLCVGGLAQLQTVAAPGGAAYLWSNGATTAGTTISQPGTYTVIVRYPNGCVITAARAVQLFRPTAQILGDTVFCTGSSTVLTAAGGANATGYQWSTGETTPTIRVSQSGTYSVTAAYSGGCTATAPYAVRQIPGGVAPFTLGRDTTVCEDQPLIVQGPSGSGLSYAWSDGSTNRTLLVTRAGQYSLRVTGRCDSRTTTLVVTRRECLTIPNIITPNGDRANERFVIKGLSGEWQMEIYSRWGKCVYRANRYANEWGEGAAPGTYYYLLQRTASNSRYKGWLEVVR
ncbi:MAG: gliding motility-associated C-terminal domain-containing protein [Hymenobacter sp.]|nr:gliding motility-associated C-terminal domain-containing protein [Hymenobacter sp.]